MKTGGKQLPACFELSINQPLVNALNVLVVGAAVE